jgi:type IV pilus assembly protein PilY1
MKINKLWWIFRLGFGLIFNATWADDIDLFMGPSNASAGLPNVLFIVDNTANWSANTSWPAYSGAGNNCAASDTKFCYERAVLSAVAATLSGQSQFNIGLMMFNNSDEGGGYARFAIREMNATNGSALKALVDSLDRDHDKGSSAAYGSAMHEAYLYFQGLAARYGNQSKTDKGTVTKGDGTTIAMGDTGAFTSSHSTTYKKPAVTNCAKNYVIFLSNGAPDNGENTTAESLLTNLGGKLVGDPIALNPSTRQTIWSDEYARFMANTAATQSYTYVIEVAPRTTGQGPANTALLKSMASQGKGQYYSADSAQKLKEAIIDALSQIQSVNSVYASVALPVSINVRGTHLNQVYMGMFRPDKQKYPRWFGNLKLYQLGVENKQLKLLDSVNHQAENSATGFIQDQAISFWTESSAFWTYRCSGASPDATLCGTVAPTSDSPDGAVVEKGAAAEKLRLAYPDQTANANRDLYTCPNTVCDSGESLNATTSTQFTTSNTQISQSDLGAADATERSNIINWVRGVDNTSPAENTSAANGARPSLVGDVLHSRPVIVNYNRTASGCDDTSHNDKDVVVFYGANDGILHALQGGKTGVTNVGKELWGFIPKEFYPNFKRLRDNTPAIHFPSQPLSTGNKPYFLDGNITVYANDADQDCKLESGSSDVVYLFMAVRRGGRMIYAFDITNPENPKFLWRKDNASSGYDELGQTWSELKPIQVKIGTQTELVLIFGAGYDPGAEDRLYSTGTQTYSTPIQARSMGRGVFIVNAKTGEIEKFLGTDEAVPSDISVVFNRVTGFAERAYVGDTGGNIWRIDLTKTDKDDWTLHKFAELGSTNSSEIDAYSRKFLYPPDVVRLSGSTGYAVLLGSGDREHPFDTTIKNRFYMLKDTGSDSTIHCTDDESSCDLHNATNDTTIPEDKKGWYIELQAGEKVTGGSVTLAGNTFFPTNQPSPPDPSSCTSNLGTARIYAVSYLNSDAQMNFGQAENTRAMEVAGGGFPPSPMPITVELTPSGSTEPGIYQGVISGTQVLTPPNATLQRRRLTYWYKEGID